MKNTRYPKMKQKSPIPQCNLHNILAFASNIITDDVPVPMPDNANRMVSCEIVGLLFFTSILVKYAMDIMNASDTNNVYVRNLASVYVVICKELTNTQGYPHSINTIPM